MTIYKFLKADHTGEYSGFDYSDYLPKHGHGKWLPRIDEIEPCASGYHGCLKKDIPNWANDDLYIVEFRGQKMSGDDKVVAQQMRFVQQVCGWNERNLRLAAADIVEKISLPIWKKYYPSDTTLDDVIDTVRRYANGKATDDELSAAGAAAGAAARSAAWSAAWSAAEAAAWSAARLAAESAARSAAWKIIYKHCGL